MAAARVTSQDMPPKVSGDQLLATEVERIRVVVNAHAQDLDTLADEPDALGGVYEVKAADLAAPATALQIAVAGALGFGVVGVERPGVTGQDLLAPGSNYTSTPGALTLDLASIKPALQPGYKIHYAYTSGLVPPAGVTPAELDAVRTSLPLRPARTASDTLTPADVGALVPVNSSSAVTLTVPAGLGNAAPSGNTVGLAKVCYPLQAGTGQLTLAYNNGVTVLYPPGAGPKAPGQGGRLLLTWLDTNTVLVEGGTP